tara:strand:+ start:448 stop:627 length:180 start_codon:yes stop_codon:yes gene_type:complete
MRLLLENYGDVRIFQDRPFGYKRYIVEYRDGRTQMYSSLWYKLEKVKKIVEAKLSETNA